MELIIIEDVFDGVIDDSLKNNAIHVNHANINTELPELLAEGHEKFFVAINSIIERKKTIEIVKQFGGMLVNIVDESANISNSEHIGPNAYIGKGVLVSSGVSIGEGTYIGMGSIIDYDTVIGNYCTLDSEIVVGHSASIGDECCIGMKVVIDHDEKLAAASVIAPLTVISANQ